MKMSDSCSCSQDCCTQKLPSGSGTNAPFVMLPAAPQKDAPCCGPPLADPAKPYEMPGYSVCHFVKRFEETAAGRIPVVHTRLIWLDWLGTMRARLGFFRNAYNIAPGLYSTGNPGTDSPVWDALLISFKPGSKAKKPPRAAAARVVEINSTTAGCHAGYRGNGNRW